jgi:hypothetical protein
VRALTRLSALENLNLNHTHITSAALKEVVKLKVSVTSKYAIV